MGKSDLQFQQLSDKMAAFSSLGQILIPPTGWIKAIRVALGMSMLQLGNRLSMSKQAILDMEKREKEGSITIKSLREVARAMDLQLVYGFVPNEGTLDALLDKKARQLATSVVMRTAQTMTLEDQGNSDARIQKAIEEMVATLKAEMPRALWD